jgi:hypothetical protein
MRNRALPCIMRAFASAVMGDNQNSQRIASTKNVNEALNVICQADYGSILVGLHWC